MLHSLQDAASYRSFTCRVLAATVTTFALADLRVIPLLSKVYARIREDYEAKAGQGR